MEDWERQWHNRTTEPYTVIHIELVWPNSVFEPHSRWWRVYYRSYSSRSYTSVAAHDELGAYMAALKRLASSKRKTDRLHEKNQEGAN